MSKYYIKIFKSKLRYELHLLPSLVYNGFIWGFGFEVRFIRYRFEIRVINRKIAN